MTENTALSTQCVHTGTMAEGHAGVNTPIHTSSAFSYDNESPTLYPRYFNTLNQIAVSKKIQALECGAGAMVTGSGMAAISTAMVACLQPGDHVVLQSNIYGGTHYFVISTFEQLGVTYTFANGNAEADFVDAWQENTKLVYIETPSNPLLEVVDIRMVAKMAQERNALSMIDNTFATPINQQPIPMGIDVVVHSATKYFGGHSDLSAGAIVTRTEELFQACLKVGINFGGCLDANACYLLERSMKTLALRVKQQNENALALAQFLENHAQIIKVNYPGLANHPDHAIAKTQMTGFGGMLSFEIAGGKTSADKFLEAIQLISKALSLGGVETTVTSPVDTSHSKLSAEEREAKGISDGLLRLSVGIEDAADLMADINQALAQL